MNKTDLRLRYNTFLKKIQDFIEECENDPKPNAKEIRIFANSFITKYNKFDKDYKKQMLSDIRTQKYLDSIIEFEKTFEKIRK